MNSELTRLAISLRAKFCCTGIQEISRNELTLFYGKDQNAAYTIFFISFGSTSLTLLSSRVDCLTATEDILQNLSNACDAVSRSDASFGSLKPAHFSSNFNLERSGILQAILPDLLDGYLEKQGLEAELRELNVYSELSLPPSSI
jgi:hypothetical protein